MDSHKLVEAGGGEGLSSCVPSTSLCAVFVCQAPGATVDSHGAEEVDPQDREGEEEKAEQKEQVAWAPNSTL